MSHRRGWDPKAPTICAEDRGAVEPQDAPAGEDEQTVDGAPGGAEGGQEPHESAESDLEPPDTDDEPPVEQPEPGESDSEPAPIDESEVPELVDDLLAWVGDNPQRARAALAREAKRPKQRKKVVALEALAAGG
jgi:hypothetical protein